LFTKLLFSFVEYQQFMVGIIVASRLGVLLQ
jgi:hypothetical protein